MIDKNFLNFNTSDGTNHSNSSNYVEDGKIYEVFVMEPFEMTIVRLSLFGVVFLIAVVGNVIVFTAPWRNPNLRTFSYYLITTLAISDFISVLGMPLIVASGELGFWIFGEVLCRGLNPTQVICSMVTTNVHTTIAIDRHRAVRNPFRVKPTGGQTALVIALILLFSIICALPAFGARKLISYSASDGKIYYACFEHFPVKPVFYQRLYTISLFLLNYVFPLIIMFCLYTRVVITLRSSEIRKQRVTSRKQSSASNTNTSTRKKSVGPKQQNSKSETISESSRNSSRKSLRRKTSSTRHTDVEKNFIKMIFLVLGIFVICYLPYQIFFLLVDFAGEAIENWKYKFIAHHVIFFITWLPNAVNPICYNAMDRYYKKAFRIILNICRRAIYRNRNKDGRDVFDAVPTSSGSVKMKRKENSAV